MDDASGHLEEDDGDSEYVNLYNMAGDYGRSSLDQPINETLALTYDLPYGRGRQFGSSAGYLLLLAAGGWQTSVINQYTSGLPVNLTYAASPTTSAGGRFQSARRLLSRERHRQSCAAVGLADKDGDES